MDLIATWNLDEFAAEFVREVEAYLAKWAAFHVWEVSRERS